VDKPAPPETVPKVTACACCGSSDHAVSIAPNGEYYCDQCAQTLRRAIGRGAQ
jgi:hypothetical protein